MTITYVRWRDASHSMSEWEIDKIEPSELQDVGFLVRETDDAVTLAIEAPEDGESSTRLWLCIPKVNILERHDMDLDAFVARARRRRPARKAKGEAQ